MAEVISIQGCDKETIMDINDFLYLIDKYMGLEARKWLESYFSENDFETMAYEYETELQERNDHYQEVMRELRKQAETLAGLIGEKELDRRAISNTAGQIGVITGRELR
jgi:hypothetical protein